MISGNHVTQVTHRWIHDAPLRAALRDLRGPVKIQYNDIVRHNSGSKGVVYLSSHQIVAQQADSVVPPALEALGLVTGADRALIIWSGHDMWLNSNSPMIFRRDTGREQKIKKVIWYSVYLLCRSFNTIHSTVYAMICRVRRVDSVTVWHWLKLHCTVLPIMIYILRRKKTWVRWSALTVRRLIGDSSSAAQRNLAQLI